MHERQEYAWDDLVGQATHIDTWHPNAVPNPYLLPGLTPENIPPYGIPCAELRPPPEEMSPYLQKKYRAEMKEGVRDLTTTIFIGEAALWQTYHHPRARLYTNIELMRVSMQEVHSVRIVPFTGVLPAGAQAPFTVYTRRGMQAPIVTRDIEGTLYHSKDPQKINEKREVLARLTEVAATEIGSQEMIRRAVKEQQKDVVRRGY